MYFTIRKSAANSNWYWRFLTANNEIIANGEGYVNKRDCLYAISLVDGGRNLPIYEV
ncbi:MAG: DUF1508 domain-containing protein [Hyphomicrobium sp.]|nr:DUF1508 domain-containing protein [Hyphomicrobium sp.]